MGKGSNTVRDTKVTCDIRATAVVTRFFARECGTHQERTRLPVGRDPAKFTGSSILGYGARALSCNKQERHVWES